MKIIAHKNAQQDYYTFLNSNIKNPRIDGINLDVLMTKDKQIVAYTPSGNLITDISATHTKLNSNEAIPLEEALKKISNNNKKIVINLLPIITPPKNEEELINITRLNEEYVNRFNQIIDIFQPEDLYVCSAYDNLVFQIRKLKKDYKVGFIISNLSSNYIDVDFYVFTANIIDRNIINQQLIFNKEIMLYILNCNDMEQLMTEIYKNKDVIMSTQIAYNQLYFINNYPNIFWKLFN